MFHFKLFALQVKEDVRRIPSPANPINRQVDTPVLINVLSVMALETVKMARMNNKNVHYELVVQTNTGVTMVYVSRNPLLVTMTMIVVTVQMKERIVVGFFFYFI